eukprot:UN20835
MIIRPIEKFLEHFEKKFCLKMRVSSEYSSLIFASFFSFLSILPFFFQIIRSVYRMVTIFLLA